MLISHKNIARMAVVTALILMVPLVAMQFTDEVEWSLADFSIAGILLMGTGLVYELATRKIRNTEYKVVISFVLLVMLFLIWAELAVGIFGTPFAGS